MYMKNFIETDQGQIGFGTSKESAAYDLFINKCRQDITEDTKGVFKQRREELYPWMPKSNMLHVSKLGCLVFNGSRIINTKTNKSVLVTGYGRSIYYYIANLFGAELSYTDITVSLRPEIDSFFKAISPEFEAIKDMPYIRLLSNNNGFDPYVIYTVDIGILIAMSEKEVGVKFIGDEFYHVVEIGTNKLFIPVLSYIGYKMGILFAEERIELIGKED